MGENQRVRRISGASRVIAFAPSLEHPRRDRQLCRAVGGAARVSTTSR